MARFVALGCLAVVGLVVTYVMMVRTYTGQALDEVALAGRDVRDEWIASVADNRLTRITELTLVAAVGLIMMVSLVRRRPRLAVAAATVVLGSVLTTEILKYVVLTRPERVFLEDGGGWYNTFPSGHATVAFSPAIATVMVVPPRWRGLVGLVVAAHSTTLAASTVTAGWHRPSDAIAAYLVVLAWTCVVTVGMVLWRGCEAPEVTGRPVIGTAAAVLLLTGAATVFLAITLLFLPDVVQSVRAGATLHDVDLVTDAYYGCMALIFAVGSTLSAVLLLAYHDVSLDPQPPVDDGARSRSTLQVTAAHR